VQNDNNLGINIRTVRKARKLTQEGLATAIHSTRPEISELETGKVICSPKRLFDIKRGLDAEILPMTDSERPEFMELLRRWHDIINNRDMEKAQEMHKQLSVIQLLPQDVEFNTIFSMYECKMQLFLNDLESASKTLTNFAQNSEKINGIMRYHYFYNQGTLNLKRGNAQTAIDFYLQAYEMTLNGIEKSITLNTNIAIAYAQAGFISHAITYLENALTMETRDAGSVPKFHLYNYLGIYYAYIGALQRSKYFMDTTYELAKEAYNKEQNDTTKANMSLVYGNYGLLYRCARKWSMAIEYINKSLEYLEDDTTGFFKAKYHKLRCQHELNNYYVFSDELSDMIARTKDNKDYNLLFKSLEYMANINADNAKAIERDILPYLMEKNYVYSALDCAIVLRDFYMTLSKGYQTRTFNMGDTANTIQRKMHEGGIVI